jgi:hypothetical protein
VVLVESWGILKGAETYEENPMTTEDIILHIFYLVATTLPEIRRHPQAKLYPSELVTIGILFALKGGYFRSFYRWLKTFFTVLDSYPVELLFPIRQGASAKQVGKKGIDKGRWSVGVKFCWLLNGYGRVVAWDWTTMNVKDKHFNPLVQPFVEQTIVLADYGFRDKDGVPDNMKICKKGTWNERMYGETALSLVTVICDLKRIRHRLAAYIQMRFAFVCAMFNILQDLFHCLHPEADPFKMSIAEFSL